MTEHESQQLGLVWVSDKVWNPASPPNSRDGFEPRQTKVSKNQPAKAIGIPSISRRTS